MDVWSYTIIGVTETPDCHFTPPHPDLVKAFYPGSFDPVHKGHVDIATRASKLFDELLIGVYEAPPKLLMFDTAERVELFQKALTHLSNVRVLSFAGLAPDFARSKDASFIVRGLRAGLDFEQEFEMGLMWKNLAPDIETICLMSSLEFQFVYSSRIKEVATLGANVDSLVPLGVAKALKSKIDQDS